MPTYDPIKQQVVDICRTLVNTGYLKTAEGNISLRIPGQPAFAITRSSFDYAHMQPQDICILDLEANRLEGEMKPSIESGMHAAVYQSRADVHAIIHTHQVYASALAVVNAPIPALFDEQVRFLGRQVEIIPYAPSGTSFLKNNVRRKIQSGSNAYMLQNHGVLIFGGTAARAIANMALLEKCAIAYLLALCTERKVTKIPLAVREITLAKLRQDEQKYARSE